MAHSMNDVSTLAEAAQDIARRACDIKAERAERAVPKA